jgi:hypothetical protein
LPSRIALLFTTASALASSGCHTAAADRESGSARPEDTGEPVPTLTDTGSPTIPPPADSWSTNAVDSWEGFSLAAGSVAGSPMVLAGAPQYGYTGPAFVDVFEPAEASLGWSGAFQDDSTDPELSTFGYSIAISSDGSEYVMGAPTGDLSPDSGGLVYLLETLPDGVVPIEPKLILTGDGGNHYQLGEAVALADIEGTGQEIIAAAGAASLGVSGTIYRFSRTLTGNQGIEAASASIAGTAVRLGQYLTPWDSDGDGLDELVAASDQGAVHFASPWSGDLSQDDADVQWTDSDVLVNELGAPLETLGDLDGDGLPELALGAETFSGPELRSGRMFIVPGGPLTSAAAVDLPTQVQGIGLAEGVGAAATSGDYDGDGALDLVVGAYHVNDPYSPGQILGYLGPIGPGIRTSTSADFYATGQGPLDLFGCSAVTIDADGDAQDDLVVGAQLWNAMGKVYLFRGADLVP